MMLRAVLVAAVVALHTAAPAHAQTTDARTALIARAQAAVVEIRIEPEPQPAPPKRVIRLSEGDCTETGGTWLGDRRCEVSDPPFPFAPRPRNETGQMGSGFVIDAQRGLILTAEHIIGAGRDPKVKLADGRLIPATLAGRDPATGVALLRVEATGLTALPLATRVPVAGEASLLVGRMLPFDTTIATSGMVGGHMPADGNDSGATMPWLAELWITDNLLPGGGLGGGPMLASNGEVLGFATAIYGRDGYGQGAATIMVALHGMGPVIEALAMKGSVERSQIGISIDCADVACTVAVVFPGSAAETGGLRVGDRILAIDGRPFATTNAVTAYIASRPVGTTLALAIERDSAAQTLSVVTTSSNALPAPSKD
jgi:S1-C subfamily serine protease